MPESFQNRALAQKLFNLPLDKFDSSAKLPNKINFTLQTFLRAVVVQNFLEKINLVSLASSLVYCLRFVAQTFTRQNYSVTNSSDPLTHVDRNWQNNSVVSQTFLCRRLFARRRQKLPKPAHRANSQTFLSSSEKMNRINSSRKLFSHKLSNFCVSSAKKSWTETNSSRKFLLTNICVFTTRSVQTFKREIFSLPTRLIR